MPDDRDRDGLGGGIIRDMENTSLAKVGTFADDENKIPRCKQMPMVLQQCFEDGEHQDGGRVLKPVWSWSSVSETNCSSVSVFFVRWQSEQFSVAVRVAFALGFEQLRALASPGAWRSVLPSSFLA